MVRGKDRRWIRELDMSRIMTRFKIKVIVKDTDKVKITEVVIEVKLVIKVIMVKM
jgi:hypothetical protein